MAREERAKQTMILERENRTGRERNGSANLMQLGSNSERQLKIEMQASKGEAYNLLLAALFSSAVYFAAFARPWVIFGPGFIKLNLD